MLSRNELQAIIHDLGSTQKEQAIARLQLDALPEEQEPPTFSPEAHDMLRAFGRNHLREVTKDGIAYAFRDGVHESAAGHNIVVTAAYKEQKGPFTVETSDGHTYQAQLKQSKNEVAYLSMDGPELLALKASTLAPTPGTRVIGVGFLAESSDLSLQLGTIL